MAFLNFNTQIFRCLSPALVSLLSQPLFFRKKTSTWKLTWILKSEGCEFDLTPKIGGRPNSWNSSEGWAKSSSPWKYCYAEKLGLLWFWEMLPMPPAQWGNVAAREKCYWLFEWTAKIWLPTQCLSWICLWAKYLLSNFQTMSQTVLDHLCQVPVKLWMMQHSNLCGIAELT